MSASLGPLRFARRFVEKPWGGRTLERILGFVLPPGVPVGETWEIVDRAAENSVVAEGAQRGRSLRELMETHADAILGDAPAGKEGRFPVLVKYIDASENLSVQVHPDEDSAGRLGGGAEAKTEAWYVIDAAEGGALYCGLRPDVRAEDFGRIARSTSISPASPDSSGGEIVGALARWEVRAGDCMAVPGGTVHAIGAGVTILEVQQNSDTTYRLYDWGRVGLDGRPRETHVEQALVCARFGEEERAPVQARWSADEHGVRTAPLADTS